MTDSQRIPWLLVSLVLIAAPALAGEPMAVHPQPAGGVLTSVSGRTDRTALVCKVGASKTGSQSKDTQPRRGPAAAAKAPGKAPAAAPAPADTEGLSNVW